MSRTADGIAIRPRSRWRISPGAGCTGALVLLLLAAAGYLAFANYVPPVRVPAAELPSPNGYDACIAAASTLQPDVALTRPFDAAPDALRKALKPRRVALGALRAALRLDYRAPRASGSSRAFPELVNFQYAGGAFVAESRLARMEGRNGEAVQRALDACELGGKTGRGGGVIRSLVGSALIAIGQRAAEPCLEGLSAPEARAAGKRLDRILADMPGMADALREESLFGRLELRKMTTGATPRLDVAPGRAPSFKERAEEAVVRYLWPKVWSFQAQERYMRSVIAEAEKPYRKRAYGPPPNDPYVRDAMYLNALSFITARTEANLALLRLQLALQEYRVRRGRYPDRLEALVPEILPALPGDPFAAAPPRYRRQGRGYLLYSVGPNGIDDGGKPIPTTPPVTNTSPGDLVAGRLHPKAGG